MAAQVPGDLCRRAGELGGVGGAGGAPRIDLIMVTLTHRQWLSFMHERLFANLGEVEAESSPRPSTYRGDIWHASNISCDY